MSRGYMQILVLLPFLFLPFVGISQTVRDSNSKLMVKISDGEIRDSNSRRLGTIGSDGTARNSNGKKLGTVKHGKVINGNGSTIYQYETNGIVRDKNGRLVYRINDGDIRNSSSKLLFKYEDIVLTHIIGYLCFFYIVP